MVPQKDKEMNLESLISIFKEKKSPFLYHDNINVEYSPKNGNLNKEEVIVRYYTKSFTDSDLVIVNALARITFGTKELIWKALELESKRYPDRPVMTDEKNFNQRLEVLTKCCLIRKFFFYNVSGVKQSYYCVTAHGYNFIKRKLNFKSKYDDYLSITTADEVMRHLAAVSSALEFLRSSKFLEISTDIPYYIKDDGLKKLYAEVITKGESRNNYILFEPFYLAYDKKRFNEQEFNEYLEDRINVVTNYIKDKGEQGNVFVILICEGLAGITRAMNVVAKKLLLHKKAIFYTTDGGVYSVGIGNALISLNEVQDGVPKSFTNIIDKSFY